MVSKCTHLLGPTDFFPRKSRSPEGPWKAWDLVQDQLLCLGLQAGLCDTISEWNSMAENWIWTWLCTDSHCYHVLVISRTLYMILSSPKNSWQFHCFKLMSWTSCLCLLGVGITGMYHQTLRFLGYQWPPRHVPWLEQWPELVSWGWKW